MDDERFRKIFMPKSMITFLSIISPYLQHKNKKNNTIQNCESKTNSCKDECIQQQNNTDKPTNIIIKPSASIDKSIPIDATLFGLFLRIHPKSIIRRLFCHVNQNGTLPFEVAWLFSQGIEPGR